MKRAKDLPMAKELLFMDTTSSCDSDHHSITFLLTPCPAGAAPLGVMITQGQTTEVYVKALKLFQIHQGICPKIVVSDNSSAEAAAIKIVWPNAIHLLCIFHILQAVWRWLWESKNKITVDDRPLLMNAFKAILYSENLWTMQESFNECVQSRSQYPQWETYVNSYWLYKEKWCLAYRDESVRGHHTNNFSEASIRIFKDIVLTRLKVYNVISLIDFCATNLEEYYVKRLRTFANFRDRKSYLFFQNMLKKSSYISKDDIVEINTNLFLVPSETSKENLYTVDCDIGSCTCPAGKYGKFCKHQSAVYQFFQIRAHNFPLITPSSRYEMAKLALGSDGVPPPSFYEGFLPEETNTQMLQDTNQFVNGVNNNDLLENVPSNLRSITSPTPSDESGDSPGERLEPQRSTLIEAISQKICSFDFDEEVHTALQKFASRLGKVQSKGQLLHLLHASGNKRFVFINLISFLVLCTEIEF